ncbi:MAG: branched-chain amino acid ABC transporter permease [Chloroflexi bacterium]|nr:branched-chain amino acid ABC transporter permease [Chloroflexota bacterium]MDA8189058.1 branched-chain amino acid ABC transporter permease [Dehalococcoidales bacterium]
MQAKRNLEAPVGTTSRAGSLTSTAIERLKQSTALYTFQGVIIAAIILLPFLTDSNYLITMATFMGMYAMLAIGLNLVLGNAGQISLGQGAFFGIGAYTYAILTKDHFPFWFAYLASPILAAIAGFVVGYIALRLRGHYFAMATLAFALIMHRLFHVLPITGASLGLYDIPLPAFLATTKGTMADPLRFYYFVWLIAALVAVFTANVVRHRVGRALSALREDEVAAAMLGINVAKYKIEVFVISAIYSSIAGSLFAGYSGLISSSAFHLDRSMDILLMVVIGGLGSVFGSILGAILWTILPEIFRMFESLQGLEPYRLVTFGIMIILIVILWPGGAAGALRGLAEKWDRSRSGANASGVKGSNDTA